MYRVHEGRQEPVLSERDLGNRRDKPELILSSGKRGVHDSTWYSRAACLRSRTSRKIPRGYSRHANIDPTSASGKRYAKAKRGASLPITGYSQRCFARRSLSRRPRSVETPRGLRVLSDRAIKRGARGSVVFRSPWALARIKPVSRREAEEMARAYPNSSDKDKSTACVQTGKQNGTDGEAEISANLRLPLLYKSRHRRSRANKFCSHGFNHVANLRLLSVGYTLKPANKKFCASPAWPACCVLSPEAI